MTEQTAPMLAALWSEGLDGIPTDALETAFARALKACKWFPTIAEIRAPIESAEDSRIEDDWQDLLEYCSRYVNRDLGMSKAPALPPDIDHAARTAGGLYYIESCSEEELQWAKKRFIEDLGRWRTSEDLRLLLPSSELGTMLRKLAPRFSLPATPGSSALPDSHTAEEAADNIRNASPEPFYGLQPKREIDPEFAAAIERAAERWKESNERISAQYRKGHGL